jgi:hypothetical protein
VQPTKTPERIVCILVRLSEKQTATVFDFELYCDDSGTDGNSPIAVAACYVASKVQWEEFVRNWDEVLRRENFSYFHMAEFVAKPEAGQKPFCDWDITKKSRVYGRLASIINTRVSKGFGIAIPKKAFDSAAPQHFRDHYAKDHYTYAVMCCIGMIADWRAQYAVTSPIDYIFDQGSRQAGRRKYQRFGKSSVATSTTHKNTD